MEIDLSGIATAITVLFVALQLRQGNLIHRTNYEDALDAQYRELVMIIPVDVMLGKSEELCAATREAIYNYFDLSNEQVFQNKKGRISKDVWKDWQSGMRQNMGKPGFLKVWNEVIEHDPNTFTYLYEMIDKDPTRFWQSTSKQTGTGVA